MESTVATPWLSDRCRKFPVNWLNTELFAGFSFRSHRCRYFVREYCLSLLASWLDVFHHFWFSLLVGISRIAIGVHWPADVLGGIIVGWTSAVLGFYLTTCVANPNHWVKKIIIVILFINAINLILFYDTNYSDASVLQSLIGMSCIIIAAVRVRSVLLGSV